VSTVITRESDNVKVIKNISLIRMLSLKEGAFINLTKVQHCTYLCSVSTGIMRISRQPFPVIFRIDKKQLDIVESFKYLGSMLTNDGRCNCEIKSRIALFTSKMDLELRKKLAQCYIRSVALCGAETWTLQAVDQKHLESFEMWCWRRMEISWTDHVRN
jgi:hypothetical protein